MSRRIRPEVDESPVEMLRVSFYQCVTACCALCINRNNDSLQLLFGDRLSQRAIGIVAFEIVSIAETDVEGVSGHRRYGQS